MAGSFADAYVRIIPKMEDFGAAIKRSLGGIKDIQIPVHLKFDPGKVRQQLADLTKAADVAITPKVEFDSAKKALADISKPIPLPVTPDVDVATAKKALADLEKPIPIPVVPSFEDAKVKRALADLERSISPKIVPQVDTARARAELGSLEKGAQVNVVGIPDFGRVRDELEALAKGITVPITATVDGAGSGASPASKGGGINPVAFAAAAGRSHPALIPSAAITATLAKSLSLAGELDRTMGRIRINISRPGQDTAQLERSLADLRSTFQALGADPAFGKLSTVDFANAADVIAKANIPLKDMKALLPAVGSLAVASGLDAEKSATLISGFSNIFKVSTKDQIKLIDALAAAEKAGIGTIEDYGVAVNYVGAQYRTMAGTGKPAVEVTKDLLGAFVFLDNQLNRRGSKAGTGFQSFLQDVAGGGGVQARVAIAEMTDKLREQGVVAKGTGDIFFNNAGNLRDLTEIQKNLQIATADLNGIERQRLLNTIFQTDSQQIANALIADTTGKLRESRVATDELGLSEAYRAANAAGLAGAWEGLKGTTESLATSLGDLVKVPAEQFLRGATDWGGRLVPVLDAIKVDGIAGGFQKLREQFPLIDQGARIFETSVLPKFRVVRDFVVNDLIPAVGRIAETVSTVALSVGRVGAGIFSFFAEWDTKAKLVAAALASVALGVVATTLVIPALTGAVTLATGAFGGLAAVIAVLTSPVTLLVAGIAAFGFAAKIAYDNVEPFHLAVDMLWQAFQRLSGLRPALDGIAQAFRGIANVGTGVLGVLGGVLVGDFSGAWEGLQRAVVGVKDAMVGMGKIAFGPLISAVGEVNRALGDPLGKLKEIAGKTWTATVNATGGAREWIGDRLKDLGRFASTAWRAVANIDGNAKQWIGDRLVDLGRLTNTAWRATLTAGGNALEWIKAVVNTLKSFVSKSIALNVSVPGLGALREAVNLWNRLPVGGSRARPMDISPTGSARYGTTTTTTRASGQTSGRAEGGPVTRGVPYIVGEEGPELFVPKISGEILTNKDSAALLNQARKKSFESAGVVAKMAIRGPQNVTGSPVDRVLAVIADAFRPATEAVSDFTDTTRSAVDSFARSSDDFAASVGGSAADFADAVTETAIQIGDDTGVLAVTVDEITKEMGAGSESMLETIDKTGGVISTRLLPQFESYGETVGDFAAGIEETVGVVEATVGEATEDIGGSVVDFVVDVGAAAADVVDAIVGTPDGLVPSIDAAGLGIIEASTSVGTSLDGLDASIGSLTTQPLYDLATAAGSAASALAGLVATIGSLDFTGGYGDSNGDGIPDAFAGAVATVGGTPGGLVLGAGVAGAVGAAGAQGYAVGPNGQLVRVDYVVPPAGSAVPAASIPPGADWSQFVGGSPGTAVPAVLLPPDIDWSQFVRAAGGPVRKGAPYIVGEEGPELFIPGRTGQIVSNRDSVAMLRQARNAGLDPILDASVMSIDGARRSSADTLAAKIDALTKALEAAEFDRASVTVQTGTEIPAWQLDLLAERISDKVNREWGRR